MDPWEISQGVVPPAGQIGGTASSPTVLGIRETTGPTLLTFGSIPDTDMLVRSGATIVGVAQPTSYTPPGSYRSTDWIMPSFNSATVLSPNVDDIYVFPFDLWTAVTIKTIGIGQQASSAAGGLFRLGVYADTAGVPTALTKDYGTVAADGAPGTKSIAIAPTDTYGPGRIWLALAMRIAGGTVRSSINIAAMARRASADGLNTSNAPNQGYLLNAAGTTLPNPFTIASAALQNNLPQIWLQVN